MAETSQKSMQQTIIETKQKIINAINESGLPLEVIGLIFEVFTNSVQTELMATTKTVVTENTGE